MGSSGERTGGNDDGAVGREAAVAALDVHELLHADVRAKTGLQGWRIPSVIARATRMLFNMVPEICWHKTTVIYKFAYA